MSELRFILRLISRRDLLKTAGAVGAAVVTSEGARRGAAVEVEAAQKAAGVATRAQTGPTGAGSPAREAYESFTAHEADMLEAIVARLVPSDAAGPGAREARAAHYIDRAVGGALAGSLVAYRAGFAAFDGYCRTVKGKPFVELSPADQDAALMDVESGAAAGPGAGFTGSSSTFFNMVKAHTWQGTFGDPYYGGNADFVGWDLLGYPGVRTMVSAADQQRLERNQLQPNHRSAYDFDGFNKASVRADAHHPGEHDEAHVTAGRVPQEGATSYGD